MRSNGFGAKCNEQGPVVQSVVTLTNSLIVKMLTALVNTKFFIVTKKGFTTLFIHCKFQL